MTPLANLEARVATYLGQMGLEGAYRAGGVGVIDADDAVVLVTCFEQDGATWVRLSAVVRTDVEPSLGLLHHLLRLNLDVLLGSFLLFEDHTLIFSVTLQGHDLDPDGFARALRYVAKVGAEQAVALEEVAGGTSWPEIRAGVAT